MHTTRSYVYIWTSYLYLTFTDIHIQMGIQGVPEFHRQNFRILPERIETNTFVRKYILSRFEISAKTGLYRIEVSTNCKSPFCFAKIDNYVSVSIRIRLFHQYREKEREIFVSKNI